MNMNNQTTFLDSVKIENPSIHENYNIIAKRTTLLKTIGGYMTVREISEAILETENQTKFLLCKNPETKLFLFGRSIVCEEKNALDFIKSYMEDKTKKETEKQTAGARKEKEKAEKEISRAKEKAEKEKLSIEKAKQKAEDDKKNAAARIEKEKVKKEKEKERVQKTIVSQREQLKRLGEAIKRNPENEEYKKLFEDFKKIVHPDALKQVQ